MAWFFVQVWVLCLVAFLLGAAVTWLAFVRPLRRRRDEESWPELPTWPRGRAVPAPPVPRPAPEPAPGPPPTNPALAVLDVPGTRRHPDGHGTAATDALDRLGVAPAIPERSAGPARSPEIPAQPGPADASGR